MKSINEILSKSILFDSNIISDIVYSNNNPAVIESVDIKKVDSKVVKIVSNQTFNLKKFKSNIEDINNLMFSEVLNVIKSTQLVSPIDFYPKGIFKKLKKNKVSNLLEVIKNKSWALTPPDIINNNEISIFTDKDLKNEIYVGDNNSLGVIINENFNLKSDIVEFELLIYNKATKKIILE